MHGEQAINLTRSACFEDNKGTPYALSRITISAMLKHNDGSINWNEPISPILPTLRPGRRDVLALLLGYCVLDWASYIHPPPALTTTP